LTPESGIYRIFLVTSTGAAVGVIVGGICSVGVGDGIVGVNVGDTSVAEAVGGGCIGSGVQPVKITVTVVIASVRSIDVLKFGSTYSEM